MGVVWCVVGLLSLGRVVREICEWASASLLFVAQTVRAQGKPETSTDYLLGRLGVLYVGMGHGSDL